MKIIFIGKPGVGKTTLFSRLTKRKTYSRPEDTESLTSDNQTGVFERDGKTFFPVDTVGLINGQAVRENIPLLKSADIVFFMCDPADFSAADEEIIIEARKFAPLLWIVANKSESSDACDEASELYGYGLPVFPISALHKQGIDELLDAAEEVAAKEAAPAAEENVSCLVVGAPNVGKSTFLNGVLGARRFKTSPIPGTTNEIVGEICKTEDGIIKFYDSAGIFRRYKKEELRVYNMSLFNDALHLADTVCFIIDASKLLTQKDLRIAAMIKHKPCFLLFNKSDITPLSKRRMFLRSARETFAFLPVPKVFMISAAKRKGISKAVQEIFLLKKRSAVKFAGLDRRVKKIIEESRLHLFILTAKQVSFSPPTILIKYRSKRKELTVQDQRCFERLFRESYELEGVPVKIKWQKL